MSNPFSTRFTIGQSPACTLVVPHPEIADDHCVIECNGTTWMVSPKTQAVGHQRHPADAIQWDRSPFSVAAGDKVWLTQSISLSFPISTISLRVGRAKDVEICVDSPSVSGHHADLWTDRSGSLILVDHGSTNGIFTDTQRAHRAHAILLLPRRTVLLGTDSVANDVLISHAQQVVHPPVEQGHLDRAEPEVAGDDRSTIRTSLESSRKPVSSHASLLAIGLLAGFLVSLGGVVGGSIWLTRNTHVEPPGDSQRERDSQSQDVIAEDPPGLAAVDVTPADDSDPGLQGKPPSLDTPTNSTDVELEVEPKRQAASTVERDKGLSDALSQMRNGTQVYWMIARHEKSGALFRLGTGIRVSDNLIATPASVLDASEELSQDGFSKLIVQEIRTKRPINQQQIRYAESFRKRKQEFETLVAPRVDPSSDSTDSVVAEEDVVRYAKELLLATDFGGVILGPDEKSFDPMVDEAERFRVGEILTLISTELDLDDSSYRDRDEFEAFSTFRLQVREIGPNLGEDTFVVARYQISEYDTNVVANWNLSGCPVFRGTQLVGMVVQQERSQDNLSLRLHIVPATSLKRTIGNAN